MNRIASESGPGTLPALAKFVAHAAALSPAERMPAVWNDQRQRWQHGERPPLEAYLAAWTEGEPDVLVDLIYGEYVLRLENGERPAPDEYLRRFPAVADSLQRQFALHQALTYLDGSGTARSSPASSAPVAMPTEIAGYRVVAPLDSGGQGQVFRGIHPLLGRDVVIKLGYRTVEEAAGMRLIEEGRILSRLECPGLVRVHDLRLHEGRPCLVMDFLRGVHLEQYRMQHLLPPQQSAALVARIARALAQAHRQGVVHRDIKPRNILIDEAGNPWLLDFGLARHADAWRDAPEERGVTGTLAYMAPEQARGEPASPRSDLFGLGGVLYFLLTGRAPFGDGTTTEVLERARRGDWDRAGLAACALPKRLRALVERTLAADPLARPATADALAAELEALARPSRRWRFVAGGVLGVVALVAGRVLLAPSTPHAPSGGATGTTAPAPAHPFSLSVRVWGGERYVDLVDSLPLRSGREVRIEAVVPAGMHALLGTLSRDGTFHACQTLTAEERERQVSYPDSPNRSVPLVGEGNELILLVTRRASGISVNELRDLAGGETWPSLPDTTLLALEPDGVRVLQRGRDFGPPRERPDPEGEVRRRLEELGRRLRTRFDYFEGVAFSHQN